MNFVLPLAPSSCEGPKGKTQCQRMATRQQLCEKDWTLPCLQAPRECPELCEGRSRGSAERGIGMSILSDHDLVKGPARRASRHGFLRQNAQSSVSGTSPAFVRDP